MSGFLHDWRKAYDKAIGWGCGWPQAGFIALRYALTGNSGRFIPPRSFSSYRIVRRREGREGYEQEQN